MLNKLRNFMYGRYGTDQFNLFLWVCAVVLLVLSTVFSYIVAIPAFVSMTLNFASLAIFVITMVRSFSRKIPDRQKENYAFMRFWNKVKQFFRGIFKPKPDAKTHRYFRCPNCSQKVRVPRGKGKIAIKCPKCEAKFIRKT